MKAIIMAAGEGKRMHPLTYTRPKPMLPIANKPILEHLILQLKSAGFKDFIFVTGYKEEVIRGYFGEGKGWGINIEYIHQGQQLGTAHALSIAKNSISRKFLLINSDILVSAEDLINLLKLDSPAMGLAESEFGQDMGQVRVEGDRVMKIWEKPQSPQSNLVNAGAYLLTDGIFQALSQVKLSSRGELEITDALQLLIDEGITLSYQRFSSWFELSYPWQLLEANEKLLKNIHLQNLGTVEENAVIKGLVSIDKGTVIRSGSYIQGPVIIGEDCDIGPNCFIRPYTSIGNGCHIGAACEVKNSVIMRRTKIPHHNYVGDSVIGEGVNLGAGTKIANLRLDEEEIRVGNIPTGRKKLGAIIGDGVKTGINSSINVGCLIGDHVFIGPGKVVSGVIPPGSRVL